MHTAIGVFPTRESAEGAFKKLVEYHVPWEEIVYLCRSASHDEAARKRLGATIGSLTGIATGMTAGLGAAMLLFVPGIGQVIAFGVGAAALLGVAGARAGVALGKAAGGEDQIEPTPFERCSEDVEFFRKVLAEGQSLIVVRSESQEVANVANGVLSRMGINPQQRTPVKMQVAKRQIGDIAVIDIAGRITFGEESSALRQLVRETLENGGRKIVFNLQGVSYVDSSGLGELVRSYMTVHGLGGTMKLAGVRDRVLDLLEMTKLNLVLEIEPDEASAIQSFETGNPG